MSVPSAPNVRPAWLEPLAIVTVACVIVGVLTRFWGLGKWPLAIDEYYFARSVQNVLHSGLPRYPCGGGLYLRGLLLQYISALLQLLGASPELAPRLIAAVTSLVTLPAAYLIGRRLGGRNLGLLAVAILAVSVWEVEIGRFGRMYAPFQAVFAWYVVFLLAYSLDRRRAALAPMLILSAIGLFVWEGGVFLLLTNFLPPFIGNRPDRLQRRDWLYLLGAACLLFITVSPLALAELFTVNSGPLLPPDYHPAADAVSLSRLDAAVMPWTTLSSHTVWTSIALPPAVLTLWAFVQSVRRQPRPLAAVALILVLACAALQQFELSAGLLVVFLLLRIVDREDVTSRDARALQLALAAWVIYWLAFGLSTPDWHVPGLSPAHTVALLGYEFAAFPDVVREVAMPWARTVPMLGLGLFVLIGAACVRACLRAENTPPAERVLLALFILLLFAASSVHPPRHETRYVFFLYPLAVLIALMTVSRAVRAVLGPAPSTVPVAVLVCLGLFALSEDFRPRHLWNIDTYDVNFRIGMSGRVAGHYHPRSDVRGAASWLAAHADPRQDIVIESFPGIDFYYPGNYYYVAETDPRFEVWSCRRGTIQRWSNLPMIHTFSGLSAQVGTGRRVWLVFESSRAAEVLARFPTTEWQVEWSSRAGDIAIVALHAPQG